MLTVYGAARLRARASAHASSAHLPPCVCSLSCCAGVTVDAGLQDPAAVNLPAPVVPPAGGRRLLAQLARRLQGFVAGRKLRQDGLTPLPSPSPDPLFVGKRWPACVRACVTNPLRSTGWWLVAGSPAARPSLQQTFSLRAPSAPSTPPLCHPSPCSPLQTQPCRTRHQPWTPCKPSSAPSCPCLRWMPVSGGPYNCAAAPQRVHGAAAFCMAWHDGPLATERLQQVGAGPSCTAGRHASLPACLTGLHLPYLPPPAVQLCCPPSPTCWPSTTPLTSKPRTTSSGRVGAWVARSCGERQGPGRGPAGRLPAAATCRRCCGCRSSPGRSRQEGAEGGAPCRSSPGKKPAGRS